MLKLHAGQFSARFGAGSPPQDSSENAETTTVGVGIDKSAGGLHPKIHQRMLKP